MSLTNKKFVTTDKVKNLKQLLSDPCNRNHLMMRVLMETGARSSEVLNILKDDLKDGLLTIRGLKGSNDRSIPLTEILLKDLKAYVLSISTDKLFPICPRQFRYVYRKLFGDDGISSKAIRHSMGVELYRKSENVLLVKHVLGHKALSSTMVYMEYVEGEKGMREHLETLWK